MLLPSPKHRINYQNDNASPCRVRKDVVPGKGSSENCADEF